jgi:hypothetical protein
MGLTWQGFTRCICGVFCHFLGAPPGIVTTPSDWLKLYTAKKIHRRTKKENTPLTHRIVISNHTAPCDAHAPSAHAPTFHAHCSFEREPLDAPSATPTRGQRAARQPRALVETIAIVAAPPPRPDADAQRMRSRPRGTHRQEGGRPRPRIQLLMVRHHRHPALLFLSVGGATATKPKTRSALPLPLPDARGRVDQTSRERREESTPRLHPLPPSPIHRKRHTASRRGE